MHKLFMLLIALTTLGVSNAAPPEFTPVTPRPLVFPEDFGSHEVFRIEWWYVTGWLETSDQQPLGFQVTFFVLLPVTMRIIQAVSHQNG